VKAFTKAFVHNVAECASIPKAPICETDVSMNGTRSECLMRPFRSETKELSATKTAYTALLRPLCGEYPSELSIFSVLVI
jgi:hypothetical protein